MADILKIGPAKPDRIAVLMSTFNGSQYILQQIESILSELSPHDNIYIRDDGSLDNTVELVQSIDDARIVIYSDRKNIGFGRSFMNLMKMVPEFFDFYFFSDQDDIWIPGRVKRALNILKQRNTPCMTCSRLVLVSPDLKNLGMSPKYKLPADFNNAICQNIATGCTISINQQAMILLNSIPMDHYNEGKMYYHDWWIYLNISYFGNVYFDSEPSVLYRQHASNQIGMSSGLKRYFRILTTIIKKPWMPIIINQISLFKNVHDARLDQATKRRLLKLCSGSPTSIAISFLSDPKLTWQSPLDSLLFRMMVIFDLIRGKIPTDDY